MSSEKQILGELRSFWERQSDNIGEFQSAASTAYYLEGEKRILKRCLNGSNGSRVLKLDLWNEVKNTNILAWLASRGATTYAIDISYNLVRQATYQFENQGFIPRFSVASLYQLPFKRESFDFVYTMGTIEHAPDMDRSIQEIFQVLKPGGMALIGVPNRHDPFLRPVLVALMNRLGIYPYGFEQSLSRSQLSSMLKRCGFEVLHSDGVLFMPGILRMAELALLNRIPWLARLLGAGHWPFRLLSRAFPVLNRYGYLVACVVRRPA